MAAPFYIHMVMVTLIMGMVMVILTISKCLIKIQVLVLQPGFLEDPASKLVFETKFPSDDTFFIKIWPSILVDGILSAAFRICRPLGAIYLPLFYFIGHLTILSATFSQLSATCLFSSPNLFQLPHYIKKSRLSSLDFHPYFFNSLPKNLFTIKNTHAMAAKTMKNATYPHNPTMASSNSMFPLFVIACCISIANTKTTMNVKV